MFNGNLGIVKSIENKCCIVDFIGLGEIILNNQEAKSLELAYACTIHKCITDDTWIYTSNGLQQLKDLNNNASIYESKGDNTKILKCSTAHI